MLSQSQQNMIVASIGGFKWLDEMTRDYVRQTTVRHFFGRLPVTNNIQFYLKGYSRSLNIELHLPLSPVTCGTINKKNQGLNLKGVNILFKSPSGRTKSKFFILFFPKAANITEKKYS